MLERLGAIRPDVQNTFPDFESRKKLHEKIVRSELERIGRRTESGTWSTDSGPLLSAYEFHEVGKVFLVGAGPGDPELITVKGLRILRSAEVVLYDALVNKELIHEAPESAEKIFVGKRAGTHCIKQSEINEQLIRKAREGKRVVRLKGGDPFIFGRGGEELEALRKAGIYVEIVPGITAGIGVPTSLGIPLTHREESSSIVFVSGHEDPAKGEEIVDWKNISHSDTIVVYMGVRKLGLIVDRLIRNGVPSSKPVAVIFGGTLSDEKVVIGKLQNIEEAVKNISDELPGLIIVGEVVKFFNNSTNHNPDGSAVSLVSDVVGEEIF